MKQTTMFIGSAVNHWRYSKHDSIASMVCRGIIDKEEVSQ